MRCGPVARFEERASWCFPLFKVKSITFAVTFVQFAVYLLTCIASSTWDGQREQLKEVALEPNFCTLYDFGAKWAPGIRYRYEFHRLLMPIFLHANLFHILVNLFAQMRFMFTFEFDSEVGSKKLLALYLFSGVCGSALSCLCNPEEISVGASGCLFGLLALEAVLVFVRWERIDPTYRSNLVSNLVLLLFINAGIGFTFSHYIDNFAHLGGFVGGLSCSFGVIEYDQGAVKLWRVYRAASQAVTVLLVPGLLVLIFSAPGIEEDYPDC